MSKTSPNSSTNPAAKGTVIQLFATGEGLLRPQPATGSLTPGNGSAFIVPTMTPMISNRKSAGDYSVCRGGADAGFWRIAGERGGAVEHWFRRIFGRPF